MKAFLLKDTKHYGLIAIFVAFTFSLALILFARYRYSQALDNYKAVSETYISYDIVKK